ncbi:MAG: hypothetical protein V4525_08195 [Pseudomonadota bacterium]
MKKSSFAGKTNEAYITTLQDPPGYLVRIPKSDKGYTYKTLRLTSNTTMETLLLEAITWRNSTYYDLHGSSVPTRTFHKQQKNNTTKTIGVRKTIKIVKKKLKDGGIAEYKIPCLIAEVWLEPGKNGKKPSKSRSKVFSINKYTEPVASQLAEDWRKEQENMLKHLPI